MYAFPLADPGIASWHYTVVTGLLIYLTLVRMLRYNRICSIIAPFKDGQRPLSSMTTEESFKIMTQLQSLEFPSALNKARSVALLKVSFLPFPNPFGRKESLTGSYRPVEYPLCQSSLQ